MMLLLHRHITLELSEYTIRLGDIVTFAIMPQYGSSNDIYSSLKSTLEQQEVVGTDSWLYFYFSLSLL